MRYTEIEIRKMKTMKQSPITVAYRKTLPNKKF